MEDKTRYKYIAWGLLGLLTLVVYGYRLWYPLVPYFDEVHYVRFVQGLLGSHEYLQYSSVHPPLWHLLVAGCVKIFGDYSLVWRMVSLVAGMGVILVMFPLTKKITRDSRAAFLATFFMAFDCLSLTQARIAMMNSTMLLFMLLSLLFFLRFFDEPIAPKKKYLVLSGIFCGLAVATKLVALNLLLFFAVIILLKIVRSQQERRKLLTQTGVWFVLAPLVIFFCAHLIIPFLKDRTLADIWQIWAFNFHYNATMQQGHPYASQWWGWPLMLRPIWFHFESQYYTGPSAVVQGIFCIGNPAMLWLIPGLMLYLLWDFLKIRCVASGYILLGFFSQWLSYSCLGRMKMFHYFYTVMPFVAMALGLIMSRLWVSGKAGRIFVICYLVLVAGMFVYWYPLLTGLPVTGANYGRHMWFKSWI